MEMDYLLQGVGAVGFPIVAYFLTTLKLNATIDKNTEAINAMAERIATCPKK